MAFPFPVSVLPAKPLATAGVSTFLGVDTHGSIVNATPASQNVKAYGGGEGKTGSENVAAIRAAETAMPDGGTVLFPDGPYTITSGSRPQAGYTWAFRGALVPRTTLGGSAGQEAYNADSTYHDGPHASQKYVGHAFHSVVKGSGQIGAQYADYAASFHIEKENWYGSSGTPAAGEIDGITILFRQGGPKVGSGSPGAGENSGSAILFDVQQTVGSGVCMLFEGRNSVVDENTDTIVRSIDVQMAPISERDNIHYGLVFNSEVGTQTSAIRVNDVSGSSWGRIVEVGVGSNNPFYMEVANSKMRWRSLSTDATPSTNMSLEMDPATAEMVWKDNTSTERMRIGQGRVIIAPVAPIVDTSTSISITTSVHHGRTLVLANAASISAVLSKTAAPGTKVRVIQRDAGVVTFSIQDAATTLRNRAGNTKTGGQGAVVELECYSNSDGSSAIWYLSGDTAA